SSPAAGTSPRTRANPRNFRAVSARGPVEAPQTRRYQPMLAQLGDRVPAGPGWRHEVKWDGFRTLARLTGGEVQLWSRRDQDLGGRFAAVARRLEEGVVPRDCVLDGEVCAL